VSVPRQSITVSRDYRNSPDECVRALELLLKKPAKEGGPHTAPEDAERSSGHIRAKSIIPEPR
jgi:hypothetical protein